MLSPKGGVPMPVDYKDLKAIGGLFMLELQGKSVHNATFYRVSERSQVIRELRATKRGVAGAFCREAGVTKLTISPKWKRGSVHIDDGDGSMTARSLRVGFLNGDKVWIEWGSVEGDGEEEIGEEVEEASVLEEEEEESVLEEEEEESILEEEEEEEEEEEDEEFFASMFEEEEEEELVAPPTWQQANTTWLDALDTLADEVGKLQTALRSAAQELDDEDLQNIADSGLAQLTKGNRTKVQSAVLDVSGSTGADRVKALTAVQSAAQDYLTHIDAHPAFAAIAAGVEDAGPPAVSLPAVDVGSLRNALNALKGAATAELAGTR